MGLKLMEMEMEEFLKSDSGTWEAFFRVGFNPAFDRPFIDREFLFNRLLAARLLRAEFDERAFGAGAFGARAFPRRFVGDEDFDD